MPNDRMRNNHETARAPGHNKDDKLHELLLARREFLCSILEAVKQVGNTHDGFAVPQADAGIGPVKYEIKFKKGAKIEEQNLAELNLLVECEKLLGDVFVALEGRVLAMKYGQEDFIPWLPAAFRVVTRFAIQA